MIHLEGKDYLNHKECYVIDQNDQLVDFIWSRRAIEVISDKKNSSKFE